MSDNFEKLFDGSPVTEDAIEKAVIHFIENNKDKINYFCSMAYGETNQVNLPAFKETSKLDLIKSLIALSNNGTLNNPESAKIYLYSTLKRVAAGLRRGKYHTLPVCPGCKYLNITTKLNYDSKDNLICDVCSASLQSSEDKDKINLYEVFSKHRRKGYDCPDCERFIPHPLNDSIIVSCPYPDCIFSGKVSTLKKRSHPTSMISVAMTENCILDINNNMSDSLSSASKSKDAQFSDLEFKENVKNEMNVLLNTISEQKNALAYRSNDSTLVLKQLMYTAYQNMISNSPQDMFSYLVHQTRNNGLQCKIFQEFIRLLENRLPFSIKKNNKTYQINDLMDSNLCIFSGESSFESSILQNLTIPNNTQEIYVGSRKGFHCRPYYIGKLLEVKSEDGDLTNQVKSYSFSKIIMKDSAPINKKVLVRHLRIPPHYQMGGMVYLNRIRKAIVDKVYLTLNGRKREVTSTSKEDEDYSEDI